MDFDHLPGQTKINTVAMMVVRLEYKPGDVREEILKCQLVCSNCHRIRTHITRKKTTMKYQENEEFPLKKNPAGGANIRHGGPFDFSPETDEETNRKDAMERYDKNVDNPVRTIL